MHIEISAGGLSGGIAVASFQNGMKKYISGTDGMISSFKAVKTKTYNLNGGGPGQHLSGALENISQRIRTEEDRRRGAETVQAKSNSFLDLAIRVDERVSKMVKQNRKELYGKYPSLKPSAGQWIKDRLSDAWNWLCKAGKDIANAAEKTWNAIKDTAQKAWNSIVTFYQEHKQIIDTILIVVGAIAAIAAVVVTGGLALAPLIGAGLTALGVSAATAASIAAVTSAVVGITAIVSTLGASTLNIIDIWVDKSDDATFQTWKKIFNVVSIITNTVYSIGNLYNAYKGTTGAEYLAKNRPSLQSPESGSSLALPDGEQTLALPEGGKGPSYQLDIDDNYLLQGKLKQGGPNSGTPINGNSITGCHDDSKFVDLIKNGKIEATKSDYVTISGKNIEGLSNYDYTVIGKTPNATPKTTFSPPVTKEHLYKWANDAFNPSNPTRRIRNFLIDGVSSDGVYMRGIINYNTGKITEFYPAKITKDIIDFVKNIH